MPLGLGKPNVLFNAMYGASTPIRRRLTIYTALSLARRARRTNWKSASSGRSWTAISAPITPPRLRRRSEGEPAAGKCARAGVLSPVRRDARRRAGAARLHQHQLHAGRARSRRNGINLIVQLIAVREETTAARYSLACNPDVTLDVLDRLAAAGKPRPTADRRRACGSAVRRRRSDVDCEFFDIVVDDRHRGHAVRVAARCGRSVEHAIGMHASALVRDGGTLQIGIGALSDAIVASLLLRHAQRRLRGALRALRGDEQLIGRSAASHRSSAGFTARASDHGRLHATRAGGRAEAQRL